MQAQTSYFLPHPQKPVGAGSVLPGAVTPTTGTDLETLEVGSGSPGAKPMVLRSCSSLCFASSASCLATASAVLALTSSSSKASFSLAVS